MSDALWRQGSILDTSRSIYRGRKNRWTTTSESQEKNVGIPKVVLGTSRGANVAFGGASEVHVHQFHAK